MQLCATTAVLLLAFGCGSAAPTIVIHTRGVPVRVEVELAVTPKAQQRGLMDRKSLPDGHGMLFVFSEDQDQIFWMKDTLIALDMVFISADRQIVGVHANTTPLSQARIHVGQPSRYVLEVPGGYAARRGIATGDRVELPRSITP